MGKQRAAGIVATIVQVGAFLSLFFVLTDVDSEVRLYVGVVSWLIGLPVDENVFISVVLLVLGAALRRRKRAALWTLIIFEVGSVLTDLVYQVTFEPDPDVDTAELMGWLIANQVIGVTIIVILLNLRPAFSAQVAPGALRQSVAILLTGLATVTAAGWILTGPFPGTLKEVWEKLVWAGNHATGELLQLRPLGIGRGPGWLGTLLDVLGALVAVAAVYMFFRGVRSARHLAPDEELQVRQLLAEHGERDSLGYFATRRDKSVVFAPNGRAAVTYRVLGGVSIASGDPVGDPEAWRQAVEVWLTEVHRYGWAAGVLGASEDGAKVYTAAGLKALEIGDEAILDVRAFTLSGPERRSVRQAVNRIERAGYTCMVRRHSEIPESEMETLRSAAQHWRGAQTERGFSMALGRLGDAADGRCVMVEAYDLAGRLRGLLSFVPWGRRGLSLDLMRRDRDAGNGLNEFMLNAVIEASGKLGAQRISLNFAMFRAVFEGGERIGAGPVLRAWRAILGVFSRFLQLESLYRSNAKYGPDWEPRFLCYSRTRRLPKVGIVAGALEGFLPTLQRRSGLRAEPVDEDFVRRAREINELAAKAKPKQARRPEQVRVRIAKLERLREAGYDPYPPGFDRETGLSAVVSRFPSLAADTRTGEYVRIAGRVIASRDLGGLCFVRLRDFGGELQVMLTGPALHDWRALVDLGDHVGVSGEVVTSKRGELSVLADEWTVTAKCLHPLPDKRKGLSDPETRVRQRYLDLVVNPESSAMLKLRSTVVRALRETLHDKEFLEVETPMLQTVHGGANARPFVTHINAYDMRMYLRIAPELYLKRLCVAGVERVFELNRNFRNEGVDASHNPEFTMLEAYQAYADYSTMRVLTQKLVQQAARAAYGSEIVRRGDSEFDISGDWPVISVHDAVSHALGSPVTPDTPVAELKTLLAKAGIVLDDELGHGHLVQKAYEYLVEGTTVEPTFYTDFPTETSPLTRQHRVEHRVAERWDLVAFGSEVGTAYTELTDPIEQRRRLEAQSLRAASGDVEAMELDEDFLRALEHGMPPTGGMGMGVDRLLMMLTGSSIRQTVLFPFARPR
nr:bifunctional lysylphosphatidylglycerol synthetase/lysine--tRNA ligase LysX [Kibdelosporangium sp. MJ126-NF4]CEL18853.1 L-O-lysylphosphatidylglycerol synthase / Lysyl-tRNA synthetase (class II) related protein found fused to membrane protein [Kibdelosporangium sp. MJ126-NF4]CTQ95343.1 L-O-lysylphosphatidylglycerol synthase (EC 2.3.2.3) / Lysyl-tRNA synthetase (class II) related protein found fused to membrane protein [Kibdelosporangium sp. MJ126-NF4]